MSQLLTKIKFNYRLLKRVIMVAPRKSRNIKKLYINYAFAPANDNAEVIIKYRFRNALWYTINGVKTTETFFALQAKTPKEITLTVHGLKETCSYTLMLMQDHIHILKMVRNK